MWIEFTEERTEMTNFSQQQIKDLIEKTNDAFRNCDSVNMDYAEFASLALSDFKEILKNPYLTGRDLRRIIRKGHNNHKATDQQESWASFVAGFIAQSSNENLEDSLKTSLQDLYKEKP